MLRRLVLISLVLSAIALGIAWQWLEQGMNKALTIPNDGYTLTVPAGSNLNQLAVQLEAEGVPASTTVVVFVLVNMNLPPV